VLEEDRTRPGHSYRGLAPYRVSPRPDARQRLQTGIRTNPPASRSPTTPTA